MIGDVLPVHLPDATATYYLVAEFDPYEGK